MATSSVETNALKRLGPDPIRAVYDCGPEAVVDLTTHLFNIIDSLEAPGE